MSTFKLGDKVTVGKGSTVYTVRDLGDREDAAGDEYVMATVVNESGRAGEMVETSRLHKVVAS